MVNDMKRPSDGGDMLDDTALDSLFAAARETAPMPSRALWNRVLEDSETLLPVVPPLAPAYRPDRAKHGLFRARISAAFGGWRLLAGLSTATLVGLWIGYAHPGIVRHMGERGGMAGMGYTAAPGFELEDFEPGIDALSALLEDG